MAFLKNPFKKKTAEPKADSEGINKQPKKELSAEQSAPEKRENIRETDSESEYVPPLEQTISFTNSLYNLHTLYTGEEQSMRVRDFLPEYTADDYPSCWNKACEIGNAVLQKVNEEQLKADNPTIPEDPNEPTVEYKPEPIDAAVGVFVSSDGMEAWITVYPPYFGGEDITEERIKSALSSNEVVWGINEELIKKIAGEKSYLKLYLAAKGEEPEDGKNGEIVPFVEIHDSKAPKEDKHGRVDFKDLDWIAVVEKDQQICEIVPPTLGKEGSDVRGNVKKAKDGRAAGRVNGKNTYYSEDGRFLLASMDGQIVKPGATYVVSEVLTIQGDVDYSTGNINVNGSVVIKGNVSPSFTVKAKYDIVVEGTVDDGTLVAGGNISILGGVVASAHGMITAGADLKCRFMEYGKAYVYGDAYFESLVLSEINCEGSVYVTSGRGLIMGGITTAMKSVEATTLGNRAHCRTNVKICPTSRFEKEKQKLLDELEISMKDAKDLEANIEKVRYAGGSSPNPEVAKMLSQLNSAASISQIKTARLRERVDKMETQSHRITKGRVIVDKAYPHVNIQIGNSIEKLRNDVDYSAFRLIEGQVECVPK